MLKNSFRYVLCLLLFLGMGASLIWAEVAAKDSYQDYLLKGPDMRQIDMRGQHSLLVCASNLEYYLASEQNWGKDRGPRNEREHTTQRIKVCKALALINADIYGLCEIEQGMKALTEICTELNAAHRDRNYKPVKNNTSDAGTYTMSDFIYDSLKVTPIGECREVTSGVKNRKYMQLFRDNASGEEFIFSMNHFQSKVSADDAQRVREATAVNSAYDSYKVYCDEEDLLIMGDLNAYAYEQSILTLTNVPGRVDLHTYFHADSSYSYIYGSNADYLDHAICNVTLLPQITGMQAFHCNSRYSDSQYGYPSGNESIFRYSDHDPILVGLRLNGTITNDVKVSTYGDRLRVLYGEGGYVRVYDMHGSLLRAEPLDWEDYLLELPNTYHGCYIVHVSYNGQTQITKYIRP